MIITAKNFNPFIYYQQENTFDENGTVISYGLRKDIYSLNIQEKDIPDSLCIHLSIMGEDTGNGPYGSGAIFLIELHNNIFIEFNDKHQAQNYFKALVKLKYKEISSLENEYPEMFI